MSSFNLGDILANVIGYKASRISAASFLTNRPNIRVQAMTIRANPLPKKLIRIWVASCARKTHKAAGTLCRLCLNTKERNNEIPNSVISINGKKTIVETPMVGRKGTVKELISVDDYEINIAGVALDIDFPDQQIAKLNELYNINESITLKCALTDIFLEEEDKVVIKSIDFQEMRGCETAQIFKMNLVTDRSFELILE